MLLLKHYYQIVIKYDSVNKFFYKSLNNLPKIKKIHLNFAYNNSNLKNLAIVTLALKFITKQKGKFTNLKNAKLALKIRKGYPVGCEMTIRKKIMYEFFFKLLTHVLPKIKNFNEISLKEKCVHTFSFRLKNAFIFEELEKQHNLFKNLPTLDITFVTNTKSQKELLFLIESHKLPLTKNLPFKKG